MPGEVHAAARSTGDITGSASSGSVIASSIACDAVRVIRGASVAADVTVRIASSRGSSAAPGWASSTVHDRSAVRSVVSGSENSSTCSRPASTP
jgi:hypothetical protein